MTPRWTARPGWRRLALTMLLGAASTVTNACGPKPSDPATVTTSPPARSSLPPPPVTAAPVPAPTPSGSLIVPAGVTAAIVVFDRQTGAYIVRHNPTVRFRSASLVKLLIVLDYFWERAPEYAAPAADRAKLDVMLRSSDDSAAIMFWKRGGSREVVSRMVARLGLHDTAPPPAAQPGYWGYTAVSAGDIVQIYRYLLETAPAPVREYVMGNLHRSTKCGADRYDQSFGIPDAFSAPWAAKQGWSGFGDRPATPCTAAAGQAAPGRAAFAPAGPDMLGEVLHTTGTVGADDRAIVAVLSVHRDGTSYATATAALNRLIRAVPVPGAVRR